VQSEERLLIFFSFLSIVRLESHWFPSEETSSNQANSNSSDGEHGGGQGRGIRARGGG